MIYGSVCSGIEAATVAWHPLGWKPAFFAEISKFPSRVLAHHYPSTPNIGDFTSLVHDQTEPSAIDLLVGGTPCQSFSVAGLRGGLDDDRGNLALEFFRLAQRTRPRWVVWENVPGVLSSSGGRDFGAILGALGELGYGFAYRVLDAQYFGLAQRRKRVFVVGCSRGWAAAAAVLFERAGLRGDPPPCRTSREDVAGSLGGGSTGGFGGDLEDGTGRGVPLVARALTTSNQRNDAETETLLVFDEAQITSRANRSSVTPGSPSPSLSKSSRMRIASFDWKQGAAVSMSIDDEKTRTLRDHKQAGMGLVRPHERVRRLTPRECERLQGFSDDYTDIPGAKDGPRYAALGNSMAVPVMAWIGRRISIVDRISESPHD